MPPKNNNTISTSADTSSKYSENEPTNECSKTDFELASGISKKIRIQINNFNNKKRELNLLLENSKSKCDYNIYLNARRKVNPVLKMLEESGREYEKLLIKYQESKKKRNKTVKSCKMGNTVENSEDSSTNRKESLIHDLKLCEDNRKEDRPTLENVCKGKSKKQMYNKENCGYSKHISEDTYPQVDEQAKKGLENQKIKESNQSKVDNAKKKKKKRNKAEKSTVSGDSETHKDDQNSSNLHAKAKGKHEHQKMIKDLSENKSVAENIKLAKSTQRKSKRAETLKANKKKSAAQNINHTKDSEKCGNDGSTKDIEQSEQFIRSNQNSSSCDQKNERSNRQLSVSSKSGSLQNSNKNLRQHIKRKKKQKQKPKKHFKQSHQDLNSDSRYYEQVIVCSGIPVAFIDTNGSCEDDNVSKSHVTPWPIHKNTQDKQDVTLDPHLKLGRENSLKLQASRKRYFLQVSSEEKAIERSPGLSNNTCENQDALNSCSSVSKKIKQENDERNSSNCYQEKTPVIKRRLVSDAEPLNANRPSCSVPHAECAPGQTSETYTLHVPSAGPGEKLVKPFLPIAQLLSFNQNSNQSDKSDACSEEEDSDELPQLFQIPKEKPVASSGKGKYHLKTTATNLKRQVYSAQSGKKSLETMRATVTDTDKVMILSME